MKRITQFLLTIITLCMPLAMFAHGYWIETAGSHKINEPVTIKLYYGEYESGERLSGNYLDKMGQIKIVILLPDGNKLPVAMKQQNDFWEGSFIPAAEGTYEIYGINEEREVQDWKKHNLGIVRPVQYLKTIYQLGVQKGVLHHSSYLDVEMSSLGKDRYQLKLYKGELVFADMKISIIHPDGWVKTIFTDKEGNASFTSTGPAMYLVSVEWIDKTPGQFKEKGYESVRYKLDFTFSN